MTPDDASTTWTAGKVAPSALFGNPDLWPAALEALDRAAEIINAGEAPHVAVERSFGCFFAAAEELLPGVDVGVLMVALWSLFVDMNLQPSAA